MTKEVFRATVTDAETAWKAFAHFLTESNGGEIVVETGKGSGLFVRVNPERIPFNVGLALAREGINKPLTDMSRNKETEETMQQLHERRLNRVKLWYGGDYAAKGGGVGDPIAVQMKEEIIAVYMAHGLTRKEAEKHVKGTAAQFLAREAEGKPEGWLAEKTAQYRAAAEATLKERGAVKVKVDLSKINL